MPSVLLHFLAASRRRDAGHRLQHGHRPGPATRSRQAAKVPVVGVVEPGAEQASAASKNRKVVVIGTEATVSSHAYQQALESPRRRGEGKSLSVVCAAGRGRMGRPSRDGAGRPHLLGRGLCRRIWTSADVLVLGCTHYPLLKPLLHRVAPKHVVIVDSADSTAQSVASQLQAAPIPTPADPERRAHPRLRFFATDSVEKFKRLGARFLGFPIDDVQHVDLKE